VHESELVLLRNYLDLLVVLVGLLRQLIKQSFGFIAFFVHGTQVESMAFDQHQRHQVQKFLLESRDQLERFIRNLPILVQEVLGQLQELQYLLVLRKDFVLSSLSSFDQIILDNLESFKLLIREIVKERVVFSFCNA